MGFDVEELLAGLKARAAEDAVAIERRQKKEGAFWAVVCVVDLVAACLLGAGIWHCYGEFWGQVFVFVVGSFAMSTMLLMGLSAWLKS
jgi:F0F1-type ATP synthase assembly protein I